MSVPSVEEVTDTELIAHLDFEPACAGRECKAGNPTATHYYEVRGTCHPYDKFLCDTCVKDVEFIQQWMRDEPDREWGCPVCRQGAHPMERIVPLRKGGKR